MLLLSALLCSISILTPGPLQESAVSVEPAFPVSTALAESVSPDALQGLEDLVQELVEQGEIVGAELLVIKNGKSILHSAYGMRDAEQSLPMTTGNVFCVRSMTKPVVGAAVLMLVDANLIELDDPVAKFLPSFDREDKRAITVEHLLTHTSGLPMSMILSADLNSIAGIQNVADLGAGSELEFEPGTDFRYSDQGTDTLTALVESVAGMPVQAFIESRILVPLEMKNSTCVMGVDSPLRARSLAKYQGMRGSWTRFWSPTDPPLFPFFLGSQGLYSTLEDYARFMQFWGKKGKAGGVKLLGARYARKAVKPNSFPFPGSTGFPDAKPGYGFLMQVWNALEADGGSGDLIAFGHGGSDGTHAWVFPKQKAMVMYFTQSRGNTSGLRVEEALGQLFLGAPFDTNQVAPPFEDYLGYYWEGEGDLYRAIIRDGDDLALEIMGKGIVPLSYLGEDRWKFRPDPSKVITFDRNEEGSVTGYHIGEHQEFRFTPTKGLPTVEALAAKVAKAHGLDRLASLGSMRIQTSLAIEKLGITGKVTSVFEWPDKFRYDNEVQGQSEQVAFDGEEVWYASSTKQREALTGERAAMLRVDQPFALFGEWSQWHESMEVIQKIKQGGKSVYLVRAGSTQAHAPTLYVEETTHQVIHVDSIVLMPGMGRIGQRANYGDFREVSGIQWPHRTEVTLANPMIGTIKTHVESVEFGVPLPDGMFSLQEE